MKPGQFILIMILGASIAFPPILLLAVILFFYQDYQERKAEPTTTSTNVERHTLEDYRDEESSHPAIPSFSIQEKQVYLHSSKWNSKRKQRLKLDNYTCQVCKASGIPLEVHHLHYRTLYKERLEDLVTVCRTCHQNIHDTHGYEHTSNFPLPIDWENLTI